MEMIDAYSWATPNGHKVHIMLEETGLDYTVHPIDIGAGDQFTPAFLDISPNNKIPAIVDQEGPNGTPFALAESGAILMYLAEKTGRFLPQDKRLRYTAIQWLMFQMGHIGPMLGQAHHFRGYAPVRISYGIERYTQEASRLYGVLDARLEETPYIAGDEYTIVDMATFPWLRSHKKQGVKLSDYPHLSRWFSTIEERPAVARGVKVLATEASRTDEAKRQDILFGAEQFRRRN